MTKPVPRTNPYPILALALTFAACAVPQSQAQQAYTGGLAARPLITQPIDEKRLVVLEGNTRLEAIADNDRGLVPDSLPLEHMQLVLQRPPELEAQLEKLIDDMQRPGSPVYHKWLTAQQYGAQFGPAQQDIDRVTGWLQSNGFTVDGTLPSGMAIVFSGNAGLVRQAFHTEIHYLQVKDQAKDQVKGETHFANMTDPQIPAALTPLVKGISTLHNFKPTNMMMKPQFTIADTDNGGTFWFIAPADLATIYNLNPAFTAGYTGTGQTVVVVEDTDIANASDVSTFRTDYGISGGSYTETHPTQTSNPCLDPGTNGNEGEAALDAEWAGASAPNAAIELASCADTTNFGGLLAVQNLIALATPPKIISMSYGDCEINQGSAGHAVYVNTFQQAAAEGVSVFVSAGDSGAAVCDQNQAYATHGISVSGFSTTPYNVAVGGTDFSDYYTYGTGGVPMSTYWNATNTSTLESAKSYIPETPWDSNCAGALLYKYYNAVVATSFTQTYGTGGFCNSGYGFHNTAAGSGGPSTLSTQPNWQVPSAFPPLLPPAAIPRPTHARSPMSPSSPPTASGSTTILFA
jgi:subtilase family serine protease